MNTRTQPDSEPLRPIFRGAFRAMVPLLLFLLLSAQAGCAKQIGDDCSTNQDCSESGDRICDRSFGGDGYCTIAGCDENTCPDESVCVRFFSTTFLPTGMADCRISAAALPCGPDAICLTSTGQCAQRNIERRFCMLKCTTAKDCRGDYICARTGDTTMGGLAGAEALVGSEDARFCTFSPQPE